MSAVLVVFAEALSAPEVVWSLKDAGFDVTAVNRRGRTTALRHSRVTSVVDVTPPEESVDECAADLATLARERGAMLMPIDDAGVAVCAHLAEHDVQATVIGPTGEQAKLALDKRRQLVLAAASGLSAPPTHTVGTAAELRDAVSEFPVVLKAAEAIREVDGRLSRGRSFVCADQDELDRAVKTWDEGYALLVQPLLAGVGEGVFGLASSDRDLVLSAHRRVRMMNPQGSGSSACETAPVDPDLADGARRFLDAAEWHGIFMLEFLRDSDGRAWFMELNGRAWGSMALALRLGLDYPAWAVQTALDHDFRPEAPPERPRLVCRHLGREIVHLLFAVRGPSTKAATSWPRPLPTLAKLLRVRRSDRWYNWRRRDWRVFVADTVDTVVAQVRGRGA